MLLPLASTAVLLLDLAGSAKVFALFREDVEGKAWTATPTADNSSTTSTAVVVAVLVAVAAIPLTAT
jgi:hypothetical protein